MRKCIAVLWGAFFCIGSSETGRAQEDGAELVHRIVADWEARRSRTEAVLFEATGTTTYVKGCFDDLCPVPEGTRLPADDYSFPTEYKWLLNFKQNWVRTAYRGQAFFECKQWVAEDKVSCFDGEEIRVFQPKETNPLYPEAADLILHKPDFAGFIFSYVDMPLFFSQGVVKSLRNGPRADALVPPLIAGDFSHHSFGLLNGEKHVILRTATKKSLSLEYWIDMEKESAVSRAITYSEGELFVQVDVTHQKIPWGWVPQGWTVTSYFDPGRPHCVEKVQVTNVAINPSNARHDFQLPISPGMKVLDQRSGKAYIVSGTASIWWWLVAVVAVVVITALVMTWWTGWPRRVKKLFRNN